MLLKIIFKLITAINYLFVVIAACKANNFNENKVFIDFLVVTLTYTDVCIIQKVIRALYKNASIKKL